MQWWYGHNAVAFFLTTPFLGLMYYFLPKAAERPVFSYRLSIVHFWSLVFIYIWAGPHHLHYTALPQWASTLGMVFQPDAVDAVVGRHDQWSAHPARRLESRRRGSGPQVLRRRHHVLRHVDVRGPDALDQERQRVVALHRLEHRARARRCAWLGGFHDVRNDLLARPTPVPDTPVLEEASHHALLDRDDRHRALRDRDVGLGDHARPHVAGVRRDRPPAVSRLSRDRDSPDPDVLAACARRLAVHRRRRARGLQHLQDLARAASDVCRGRGRSSADDPGRERDGHSRPRRSRPVSSRACIGIASGKVCPPCLPCSSRSR